MTKPRFPIFARYFPLLGFLLTFACLPVRTQAEGPTLVFVSHPVGQTSVPLGVTTTCTYNDHDSLLTDVAYSDGTPAIHYSNFDAYGRAQTMTDGTGTQTFTYDDDNDLTGKTVTYTGLPAKSLSYTFYNDGSRHTMGTPAGMFTYTYDADGRITGITDPYSTASSWAYYNNDWLTTQHMGSGVTNGYTYNAAGQVTAQTNTATVSGSTFNIGSYHYDGVGNLLGYTATGSGAAAAGTYSYGYDSKDEVTSDQFVPSSGGTAFNRTYAYDGAGNPTTFRGQSLTFNADNQPTGTTLTFDGDGNTTYDGGSAVTWNGADQLTSWGSETNIKYDGFGLRASRVHSGATGYLLYDGDTPVCDLDSSGNVVQTVTMGPTGMAHLHSTAYGNAMLIDDPRGNAVQTINASGTVTNSPAVDAYGQTGSNVAGLFDFQDTYPTGQFGAGPNAIPLDFRDYDTSTGRLLSRDPMGYAGGINLYSYTQNNPVNGRDPSGLQTEGDANAYFNSLFSYGTPSDAVNAFKNSPVVKAVGVLSDAISWIPDPINPGFDIKAGGEACSLAEHAANSTGLYKLMPGASLPKIWARYGQLWFRWKWLTKPMGKLDPLDTYKFHPITGDRVYGQYNPLTNKISTFGWDANNLETKLHELFHFVQAKAEGIIGKGYFDPAKQMEREDDVDDKMLELGLK